MRLRGYAIIILSLLFLGTAILYSVLSSEAENPTSVKVKLYRAELYKDKNDQSPQVVFDNSNGVEVDIISPQALFGKGNVSQGTYKRIRFIIHRIITYSGPDPCQPGQELTNEELDIGQEELYFATADDGGGTSWVNNGSKDSPFFMQSPIEVAADKTTTVKLIFNTAGTLQCINNVARLLPPTINITNVIEGIAGTCDITGDWWFVHYNIYAGEICDNSGCRAPQNLHERFATTEIVAGWGTVKFNDDTWQIDLSKNYIDGGMSEHRHNLLELRPDDGYKDILGSSIITGTYTRSGNRIIMHFPEGGYIEGAVSSDCKTFAGILLGNSGDNDLVFALKKGTGLSSLAEGKYLMSEPGFGFCYDVSGTQCSSSGDGKIKYLGYRNEIAFIDGIVGHWENSFEYEPQYDERGNLTAVKIRAPGEELGLNVFPLSSLTFRDDGLLLPSSPDNPQFVAIGENRNGLFAGVTTAELEGNDRINVGFMVKIADNPALSDLNGRWYISIIEARVEPGSDNQWESGDEKVWYGLTTGEIVINNGKVVSRSFMHKNIFDGSIEYESGSGETIELKTECYKPGEDVLTACSDPNAPRIPVFYIYGTGSEILAKMTIDSAKKALTFWAPVDLDNKPPTEPSCNIPNASGEYYCDDIGGSPKALFGVGVKIE